MPCQFFFYVERHLQTDAAANCINTVLPLSGVPPVTLCTRSCQASSIAYQMDVWTRGHLCYYHLNQPPQAVALFTDSWPFFIPVLRVCHGSDNTVLLGNARQTLTQPRWSTMKASHLSQRHFVADMPVHSASTLCYAQPNTVKKGKQT